MSALGGSKRRRFADGREEQRLRSSGRLVEAAVRAVPIHDFAFGVLGNTWPTAAPPKPTPLRTRVRLAATPGKFRSRSLGNIAQPNDIVLCPLRKHACQRRVSQREETFPAPQGRCLHSRDVSDYFRGLEKQARSDSNGPRRQRA